MRALVDILFSVSMVLSIILFTILIIRNVLEIKERKEFWNDLKRNNRDFLTAINDNERKIEND